MTAKLAEPGEVDSNVQHLEGGRPWQWVFESLRFAVEPATLVPTLCSFSPRILHCCQELPPKEVAADAAFLVQAVAGKHLPAGTAEAARICRLACVFVRSVFKRQQLEFNADSLLTLLQFFRGTITSATAVVKVEGGETEAGRAKVESVAALGQFLLQLHNGGLLTTDDVSGHVLFLAGLITYPVTPFRRKNASDPPAAAQQLHGHNNHVYEMEVQRLTLVAIGSLVSQARHLVCDEAWNMAIQALRVILESVASKKTLVEDYAASRYYVDLLRCVYIVVSKPDWSLKEHVGAFVKVLRMFFRYGLSVLSEGKASCNSSVWLEEDPIKDSSLGIMTTSGKAGFISSQFSFDTINEHNAVENDKDAFVYKSTELRLYAISTIQAMTRGDPEGVKKRSALLLLADNTVQPRSDQATLLTVLLSDPMPKVRAAAANTLAAMLECHQVNSDHRQIIGRKGKGLSASQWQLFIEVQAGLVYAILHEKHEGTLLAALKALSTYIATAPFSHLPTELLSDIFLSVTKLLRSEPTNSVANQSSVKIAAISCLKAALSVSPASTQLEAMLSSEAYTGSSSSCQPRRSLLFDLIYFALEPAPPNVQVETIMALKAAAHNYPEVVATYWNEIFEVVARVIDLEVDGTAPFDPKNISSSGIFQTGDKQLDNTNVEVRGAAFLSFAGLSSAAFFSLPAPKQDLILSAISRGSQPSDHETPAAQLVGLEAVGFEGLNRLSKRNLSPFHGRTLAMDYASIFPA